MWELQLSSTRIWLLFVTFFQDSKTIIYLLSEMPSIEFLKTIVCIYILFMKSYDNIIA